MGSLSRQTNHTYASKETDYAGVQFRSRLEARWALLFDTVGIPWQYEPRLFRTPEGGYLPDFLVGKARPFWLEIKGPEPIERDYVRAKHVAIQTGAKFRFLVGPIPKGPSHGILRTRVLPTPRSRVWRPADWRTPWPAAQLDAALLIAEKHDFEFPWKKAV